MGKRHRFRQCVEVIGAYPHLKTTGKGGQSMQSMSETIQKKLGGTDGSNGGGGGQN